MNYQKDLTMIKVDFSIAVHGGAWEIPDAVVDEHRVGCLKAFEAAEEILANGGRALDAAEKAVIILEDNPTFDAGRGSHLNEDGFVQLDAGIMNGEDMSFGSVAAIEGIKNPIMVARKVQESEHTFLVGEGANRFATQNNFNTDYAEWLIVEREIELWKTLKERDKLSASEFFITPHSKGTVGAIARDKNGNFAAATSTGGTPFKPLGRVGDTPICGAGFFAENNIGACSTTGWGESIAKVLLAHYAVIDSSNQEAADRAIQKLASVGGAGGLILINNRGFPSVSYNTKRMAFCFRDPLSGTIMNGPWLI